MNDYRRNLPHVFVYGNPCDGFRFVGPFEDYDAALQYGEAEGDGDWWITELDAPAEQDPNMADYDDQGNLKAGCNHGQQ